MNHRVLLVRRPRGIPAPEHFDIDCGPMPAPRPGQVLVRNEYLSVDPAMRGWVNEADNYRPPVPLGSVMPASAVGRVVESRSKGFDPGDLVVGRLGWQEYAVADGNKLDKVPDLEGLPSSLALGVLGANGLAAWFGVNEILRPRPGDTVVVSTAAGSVGSAAGQLAKLMGCRTVGIAGGAAKVGLCLDEFGFEAAVDYKSSTFAADLRRCCPAGVDRYFDNTGGAITDEVMSALNVHAAVVICGTASLPAGHPPLGPRWERRILTRRARVEGLLVSDFGSRFAPAVQELTALVRAGKLRYREDILDGLESAPGAVARLYAGSNTGKYVIRLHPDEREHVEGRNMITEGDMA
jgi:NADPH-dependent curcumin reductase CurA